MFNPDFLLLVANISLVAYLILLFGIGIWTVQGQLPTSLRARYSRRVVFMSQMPFAFHWREGVLTTDLPVFERARLRRHVLLLAGASVIPLLLFYGYAHAIVQLYYCNIQGLIP
jgi:hypothetical protein